MKPDCLGTLKIVAVLPPPTTGMTHVTAALRSFLSSRFTVLTYAISKKKQEKRLLWAVRKHTLLIFHMIGAAFSRPFRSPIYIVLDAGGGGWGSIVLTLIARVTRTPLVVHHHAFSYINAPTQAANIFFKISDPRTVNIVLCLHMASRLKEVFGRERNTFVLSNAVFVQSQISTCPRTRLLRVGFLGNITKEKGIRLFMATVRQLHRQGFSVAADIAGPVTDPDVDAEIDEFIAEDPTARRALGPIYGPRKQTFFDEIDVLLFPSQYVNEAQPVTVFESLAAGVPVLATDRGCISDQLPNNWVIEETNFVAGASSQILEWKSKSGMFYIASAQAICAWQDSLESARVQLENLTETLSGSRKQSLALSGSGASGRQNS